MKKYFYRNLAKNVWSMVVGGKVAGYHRTVTLVNPEFRVRPGGRNRVLEEKRKNVHAFAIARRVINGAPESLDGFEEVTYNPYAAPYFTRVSDGRPVLRAKRAVLTADMKMYAEGTSRRKGDMRAPRPK